MLQVPAPLKFPLNSVGRTLLPGLLCLIVMISPLAAQQDFTLAEDDIWEAVEDVDPGSPEGQLIEARRALAERDYTRAENLATRWLDRHRRHPLRPEAYLIRADSKKFRGDEYEALFDYEYIARVYPGSDAFTIALEREFEIARQYAHGMRRKLWGMRIVNAADEAQELLIRIQERMPGSRLAERAGMELADFYFRRGEMTLAAEAYDLFTMNYPNSEQISKARRRLIYSHLASFKGPEYDAAGLHEARIRLQELKAVEPRTAEIVGADALLIRIDESDAAKLLENARWYRRTGDLISAELTIRRLVERYPTSRATAQAMDLIDRIKPNLPARTREQMPDYDLIREGNRIAREAAELDLDEDSEPENDT
ncbi:MAG: outer membrane protein assembly factor BamD [Phycisphaerales bacterium]|nr:MAG: outer membrane protein assembly factor BamD [Phycisphaerales bacterium]